MKGQPSLKKTMTRRRFLGAGLGAGAVFSIVPGRVLGLAGQTPPSERLNIAAHYCYAPEDIRGLDRLLSAC
jgi:hypothetical protein